ncbi:hypothetical protein HRH25_21870 [Flavisolibacter sp. BT320]|nr:hypothetical protein [Flavisolibacter longurius]
MKRIVAVLAMLCLVQNVSAQTWDEWFRQSKTQIKYLVEQISALTVYGTTVKKGYDLVDAGLKNIGHLKESDLIIHRNHFTSLLQVREGLKASKLVQRIATLQAAIQKVVNECKKKRLDRDEFSSAERNYFARVLGNISTESKVVGDETVLLTSDGHYQMTDDERLKKLQSLHQNMEELYVFVRHFANDISIAALNRFKERKEAEKMRTLY